MWRGEGFERLASVGGAQWRVPPRAAPRCRGASLCCSQTCVSGFKFRVCFVSSVFFFPSFFSFFLVPGFGFRVSCSGFRVSGFGFRVDMRVVIANAAAPNGYGCRFENLVQVCNLALWGGVSGFGFRAYSLWFRVEGLWCRVEG